VNLSDYQILTVIKTYIRNMRGKVDSDEPPQDEKHVVDDGSASGEGMKKIVFDRIDEIVTEKIKKHEAQ
jgi:hypothetical protein